MQSTAHAFKDNARRALDDEQLQKALGHVRSNFIGKRAKAAAGLMAMNNVYYRFRHFMGEDSAYARLPAKLRMARLGTPATSKVDLELFSLAVSAINGCELCVQSHEQVVRGGGLSEHEVHAAARLAAVVSAVAFALRVESQAA